MRPVEEVLPGIGGSTEELGDDEHRERLCEVAEKVERSSIERGGDEAVGVRGDPWTQPLDPLRGEAAVDQPAQPPMLRWLQHQQRPFFDVVVWLPVGPMRREAGIFSRHHRLRHPAEAPVAERPEDIVVAGEEPPLDAVVARHGKDRSLLSHRVQGRVWVCLERRV